MIVHVNPKIQKENSVKKSSVKLQNLNASKFPKSTHQYQLDQEQDRMPLDGKFHYHGEHGRIT